MTEHTTLNTVIHAAFRRDLARFEQALAAFPAGSQARADQLRVAWDNFTTQLHHHHEDEETIFFPALETAGADLSLLGELEAEHAVMQEALVDADRLMASFAEAPTRDHAEAALAGMNRLRTVLESHLEHEERDLEPLSGTYYGTAPLAAARKQVRKAHPGTAGTFIAWLLDGADDDAKAGLRKEIPTPVVFLVNLIGGRHYRRTVAPTWA